MGPPSGGSGKPAKARVSSRSPSDSSALDNVPTIGATESLGLAQLTDSLPFIVWTADAQGAVIYFNDALVEYTRRDPEELLTQGWLAVLHPDDVPLAVTQQQHTIETADPYEIHVRLLRWDGEYRWHKVQAKSQFDKDGNVLRRLGSAIDVHELRLLEVQAAGLAADLEAVLESIADGVLTLDKEYRFTYLNHNAEELTLRSREDLLGRVFWDAFPETEGSDLQDMFRRVVKTRQAERMDDYGEPMQRWFEVSANPTPSGLTIYLRDITQVKSLSEQLAIAQRMEAMGQLTGGIAHDFNNLLTVIIGGTESLLEEPNQPSHCSDTLGLISQAATRAAELTHRLLAFARKQPLAPQAIDVSAHVSEFVPLLKRTLGEGVRIVTSLTSGLPAAHVDPGQFENALLNLGINARDAMPGGGTLTLKTNVTHLDEAHPALLRLVPPGTYIITTVSDTGMGIPVENLGRLFDPFFTTKPVGQGSGLGLAMVYGFIRQSGGYVAVYSEEGRGTTIRMYLPVASEEAVAEAAQPISTRPATQGTGHILLVEDDALVRQFAATQLTGHGYAVTLARSGPEALRLLPSIDHLDLLFTDLIMPGGMTGVQLAAEVISRRPGTPVLYSSGYPENINLDDGLAGQEAAFLAKPYSGTQLVEAVQRVVTPPIPEDPGP